MGKKHLFIYLDLC